MFSSPFNRDSFRHLPMPSVFSYSNYIGPGVIPHLHSQHTHEPPRHHRHRQNAYSPHHHHQSRHHRQPKHHTHYDDTEPSSSEQDTPDESYYTSPPSPSPFHARLHNTRRNPTHNNDPTLNLTPTFRPLHARVSHSTASHLPHSAILILPQFLTRLRVQIRSSHGTETLRATVAGDMRFRDAVKQLVPEMYHGDMRVCVKMRGAWQDTGGYRVSQIVEQGRFVVNERGEVDVKVEVGGRGGERGRGRIRDV